MADGGKVPTWVMFNARDRIESDLRIRGKMLRDLAVQRRALLDDVSDLMRQGAQLTRDCASQLNGHGPRVELDDAAQWTGLTVAELERLARRRPRGRGGDVSAYSNRYLAQLHAGYGYGGHEEIDEEFWRRFPGRGAWHRAIHHLYKADHERWEAEHPDASPMEMPLDGDPVPGTEDLTAEYRRSVDAMQDRHWPPAEAGGSDA